jgi:hypothetical protein
LRPDSYGHLRLRTDGNNANSRDKLYQHIAYSDTSDRFFVNSDECTASTQLRATNSCIRLFASIFMDQTSQHKEQLTKHFLALVTKALQVNGMDSNTPGNITAAIMGLCREMSMRESGGMGSAKALTNITRTCESLMSSPYALVRRSAGESLGLLSKLHEEGVFTDRVVDRIIQKQLASKDPAAMTGAVFALGCIHRYVGAMKTAKHLSYTVAALQSLGRDFSEPSRLWMLHSLWLSIDTGGVSFASYVEPTLAILYTHTLHDVGKRTPAVSQCLGRIINGVMSAMGPELAGTSAPNSNARKFLVLFQHLLHDGSSVVQVEIMSILQQLIMWSSALEEGAMLELVSSGLSSPDPNLRMASIKCLRGWGEKYPNFVLSKNIDNKLMTLIDSETDPAIKAFMQSTFESCIYFLVGAGERNDPPTFPSATWRLLDVCKRVIVGSKRLPSDSQIPQPNTDVRRAKARGSVGGDDSDEDGDGDMRGDMQVPTKSEPEAGGGLLVDAKSTQRCSHWHVLP